jgi:hypothetical protein
LDSSTDDASTTSSANDLAPFRALAGDVVGRTATRANVRSIAAVAGGVRVVVSATDVAGNVGVLGDRWGGNDGGAVGLDDWGATTELSGDDDRDVVRVVRRALFEVADASGDGRKGDVATDRLVVEEDELATSWRAVLDLPSDERLVVVDVDPPLDDVGHVVVDEEEDVAPKLEEAAPVNVFDGSGRLATLLLKVLKAKDLEERIVDGMRLGWLRIAEGTQRDELAESDLLDDGGADAVVEGDHLPSFDEPDLALLRAEVESTASDGVAKGLIPVGEGDGEFGERLCGEDGLDAGSVASGRGSDDGGRRTLDEALDDTLDDLTRRRRWRLRRSRREVNEVGDLDVAEGATLALV